MGISYSAVKTNVPEAWEIGKDYYRLTELFPPCAGRDQLPGFIGKIIGLLGSRHIVNNTVFKLTDIYNADEMIKRANELKQENENCNLQPSEEQHFRDFFTWAKDDPIQFIADFDELEIREAQDEYQLCATPSEYHHMDSWYGEAGRKVGEDYEM